MKRVVTVKAHKAYLASNLSACYFINVTNLSPNRPVEVTHVWYEEQELHIPIVQPSRLLPTRLDLDQSWETWIQVNELLTSSTSDPLRNFRVRLSSGEVISSEPNLHIPPLV